jgi:hypothetical protein
MAQYCTSALRVESLPSRPRILTAVMTGSFTRTAIVALPLLVAMREYIAAAFWRSRATRAPLCVWEDDRSSRRAEPLSRALQTAIRPLGRKLCADCIAFVSAQDTAALGSGVSCCKSFPLSKSP